MSTPSVARPRQTTMAGAMVMLAGVFVVLSVWDAVSRLRSIETREAIEGFLADAPGRDLGLSVESMIQTLQGIATVAALCSVAAVALGWRVLQGSRQARVVLSVLAVPIFVTGLVAGGFMSSLLAVATAMLWLSPSREWFAGTPLPEPVKPLPAGLPAQPVARGLPTTAARPTAPQPVRVALIATVVVAGVVFAMTLVSLVFLAAQPDVVLEELRKQNPDLEDQGISESLLLTTSYVSGAIALVWSGAAVVLAVLMAGRRSWAARVLLVSAVACAVLCLVATFASPVALVPAVAALITTSSLRRPETRAWLNG
ncbi:hypothetical protein [Nocardioides currus]|uniref:DUF4064 domain-containing protein n=1 Tax=Nocardioides currus TaxID=2133958 RepID=A0A2R7YTY2_9ACTN|nr:hypothetical protein [Nocardioides currus]PUA79784.1 hypothetical protein C7S10_17040 [Nocardioides currus]